MPLPRLAALCPNLAFLAPLASTQELLEVVKEVKGRYLVTADHGNADDMAQVLPPAADKLAMLMTGGGSGKSCCA